MIRQAVFYYQAHSQRHDAVSVVAFSRCQIAGIGAEVNLAVFAPVLRIRELDVARALGTRVTDIMQSAAVALVAIATAFAAGTRSSTVISRTSFDDRLRQVCCRTNLRRDVGRVGHKPSLLHSACAAAILQ